MLLGHATKLIMPTFENHLILLLGFNNKTLPSTISRITTLSKSSPKATERRMSMGSAPTMTSCVTILQGQPTNLHSLLIYNLKFS
ncbi:hypothetical protein GIB67_032313 [Kingdonia uniflora]|uniref:Uncharacterized protein n=1 Tax=Kingdonia uniflora TaxID=39325 RepID=A0A7J7MXP0_9MAGN|nr:hypothetical protein GIB67_032313 [Kingdonia uniflora]